jgi:hypothetical protein
MLYDALSQTRKSDTHGAMPTGYTGTEKIQRPRGVLMDGELALLSPVSPTDPSCMLYSSSIWSSNWPALALAKEMRVMSQASRPQQPPQVPQSMSSLFDPKTIVAREYPGMLLGFLAIWCFAGFVMMFFGSAFGAAATIDTAGLVVVAAEAIFILTRDRKGFYTGAGFFKVDEWSRGQRVALAIIEVLLGFVIALPLYVIRIVMKQYVLLQQPAPLAPPPKRKRPQQRP